jgi:hypothetical protein
VPVGNNGGAIDAEIGATADAVANVGQSSPAVTVSTT